MQLYSYKHLEQFSETHTHGFLGRYLPALIGGGIIAALIPVDVTSRGKEILEEVIEGISVDGDELSTGPRVTEGRDEGGTF